MTQVSRAGGQRARAAAQADQPARRARRLTLVIVAVLGACTPPLDWRQLRPDGWGLSVSFPCRPASHARAVPLAGAPVELTLLACSADGHTFAIASADLADPARVDPALRALGAAALANVQGTAEAEQAAVVPGMTPYPSARRWHVRGRLPDGVAVQEQVMVFGHGLRVFQATVVGPRTDDALVRPFFDSIEVAR